MSSDSNVKSLADAKKAKEPEVSGDPTPPKGKEEIDTEAYFAEMARLNEAKKRKLEKDRLGANKGVLRSYRIKN